MNKLIEGNYKYEYNDLMDIIQLHAAYEKLLKRFVKNHPQYTYEIILTPGDYEHKLEIFVKECYE